MWRWRRIFRRIESFFRHGRAEQELSREVSAHLVLLEDEFQRRGLNPHDARLAARRAFGNVEQAKELHREERSFPRLDQITRDIRYGFRTLKSNPGFTCIAVLTLALGIGTTTAMFSVINGILIRPLPYPDQDRLIELVHEAPGVGISELFASPAIYFAYREHSRTFESVALWDWDKSPATVTGAREPEAVQSLELTHELLSILGARLLRGRDFSESDDVPGSTPTAIISYGYWRRHFGESDPLGKTLVVDGIPRRVIGVLAPSFRFFEYPADIFYPLQLDRSSAVFPSFDGRGIARLKKGVTLREANADAARMLPILVQEFASPERSLPGNARFGPKFRWLKDTVVGNLDDTLWLLMATIALLLSIACANVANLVLVRTQARQPELAIRTALGGGRSAIARVLLTESSILGIAGGATGLAIAYWCLPLVLSLGGDDLPGIMTVVIDPTVLLITLGVSFLAIVLFGLLPLLHLSFPVGLTRGLHSGGRSSTEGRESSRARHLLVIAQVALALILLIGAGLMTRTFQKLRNVDPGFRDPDTIQTFQLRIPSEGIPGAGQTGTTTSERTLRMQQQILDRLRAVSGVESVGFSSFNDGLPMDGDGRQISILPYIDGRAPADGVARVWESQRVSPGFFETLRTPMVAGRTFDWNDVYNRRPVMLVSENLARKEWGSVNAALGRRISPDPSTPGSEIVGVVKDVHHNGLSQAAPETVVFPAIPTDTASFVIRSERVNTVAFLQDLRKAVSSVNGNLSPARVQTLGDMYRRSIARTSMTLQLLAITGAMSLLLSLIGVYGVVSYAALRRRREVGVRLALGASPGEVRRMFVRHALVLAGIGVVIGLGAAVALTRLMTSQLFGVAALDPLTYAAMTFLMLAASTLASYLPAWRASGEDALELLKVE